MADPTMEERAATVADLGDLLDLSLCARHIADSCLAWLTLGEEMNFYLNVFFEVRRSRWNPESWDALEIITAELDDRRLPRPAILQTWLNDKAGSNRNRPKNGGQATLGRDHPGRIGKPQGLSQSHG